MSRPVKFEEFRYVGDKRSQVVYDLDSTDPESVAAVEELMVAETFLAFGPDTLDEARNRGYTLATPGKRRVHRKPRA